ncbi:hypothetical protein M011DRAFT_58789 [Sporormia fimetaria CBS 119925]|uniref:Uncharacterized protein n=1 Tax=Sporormia fimetaria CBS 119925 TaxID=1340428 RepID=A0A6A6VE00_9PLEO|nr:hypothetical protein M011DRAFT_58789 [Sporormia fimetaria CBS 119925]
MLTPCGLFELDGSIVSSFAYTGRKDTSTLRSQSNTGRAGQALSRDLVCPSLCCGSVSASNLVGGARSKLPHSRPHLHIPMSTMVEPPRSFALPHNGALDLWGSGATGQRFMGTEILVSVVLGAVGHVKPRSMGLHNSEGRDLNILGRMLRDSLLDLCCRRGSPESQVEELCGVSKYLTFRVTFGKVSRLRMSHG